MKKNLNVREVKAVFEKKRDEHVFKESVRCMLGHVIDESWSLDHLASIAVDELDAHRRSGISHVGQIPSGLLVRFMRHADPNVRKIVASVIPEGYLHKMVDEKNCGVRRVVAHRAAFPVLREMIEKHDDDEVAVTLRRRLREANEEVSKYEKLSDFASEAAALPELTDAWYDDVVDKMLHTYSTHVYAGDEIEFNWEERAVDSFCAHVRATSGVEVDRDRLYNAVLDALEERDSEKLGEVTLRSTCTRLDELALLEEGLELCEIDTHDDNVAALVESKLSPSVYVGRANEVFAIEYDARGTPVTGHIVTADAVNEHALDVFAKNWETCNARGNRRRSLTWTYDTLEENVVRFTVR